ncbi:hypothetical protein [Falsiroseomonas sp.]|uniref:hypothetical protein n=1 Tax=Falsiroseomonas sp. TaxID=2870721 RepID=UPI003567A5CC
MGETTTTDSLTITVAIETSTPDDSEGLAGTLGGEALAVGDDTFTFGSITAEADGDGYVSEIDGSVTMTAAAEASGDDVLYVSADTFAATSDGTEASFTYTEDSSSTSQTTTDSTATVSSTTTLSAFNIESSETETELSTSTGSTDPDWTFDTVEETDLDGNLAILEFDAQAYGDETYVSADGFVLAVEDELSLSAGYVDIAIA